MSLRFMSGDIVAFMNDGKLIKAQIVRVYPSPTGEYRIAVLDEEGKVFRRDTRGVITIGQRIPGTYTIFTANDALQVRQKTDALLQNDAIQDAIYTITDNFPKEQNPRVRKIDSYPSPSPGKGHQEMWDIPLRLALPERGSTLSPEFEQYLTWSEVYKRHYEKALSWLQKNAPASYDVYKRCVLGGMKQSQLAKEKGVSRPAITLRKKAALAKIQEELLKAQEEEDVAS